MNPTPVDVAIAAAAALLIVGLAPISPIAAAAITVLTAGLVLAGARRSAAVSLCVLAALALAGVRIDANHRPGHSSHADVR